MVKGKKNVMRGNRRTKRVKRTKRTQINRRTKRSKRTQINRRTKRTKRLSRKTRRSRRMRGGMGAGPSGGTGRGGVEETIQIGNERFRPPNDYEKGDGERIVGYRVCVEMNQGSEFWDTGKIISFQKALKGASSHTIHFDGDKGPTVGVKLMRGKTTTDPEKKNWKILSLQYTPEQLKGDDGTRLLGELEKGEFLHSPPEPLTVGGETMYFEPVSSMLTEPEVLEAFGAPKLKPGAFKKYLQGKTAKQPAENPVLTQAQRAIEIAEKARTDAMQQGKK